MKKELIDRYGRKLDYLRLSVTDRCNFRCYYCMPEEGMDFVQRKELLSYEELDYLTGVFVRLGVRKIRITGGEPFVRNGIMDFITTLAKNQGLREITLTSNGSITDSQIQQLYQLGIRKINISLDALDKQRFFEITRRDKFDEVFQCILTLLKKGFSVKLNCVVDGKKNIADIVPFVQLTENHPLSVRFLEEMPFNGTGKFEVPEWNHLALYDYIAAHFPTIQKVLDEKNSTSVNYQIPGYQGTFGIIPAFSRTFCGTCNRIRLSATGELRTCLYGPPVANLRDVLRSGASEESLVSEILDAVAKKEKDGFKAEELNAKTPKKSMSFLGG
ncbi:cyclic pyranopterin phosphate synthase [Cyclobacterium lianum]|uniref:GTP 3',8-cyclase n=1 Tax=Cyclobacterium lianum TaxID=388280 RepID=A0A1M7L6F6_9BACT|nr:GTP 3',8-cyclase MoaA [Cyclobacterium lianum]SHM73644.1 cyclic pyranopterin phosphate synthase [Cyclobacterium lianum]